MPSFRLRVFNEFAGCALGAQVQDAGFTPVIAAHHVGSFTLRFYSLIVGDYTGFERAQEPTVNHMVTWAQLGVPQGSFVKRVVPVSCSGQLIFDVFSATTFAHQLEVKLLDDTFTQLAPLVPSGALAFPNTEPFSLPVSGPTTFPGDGLPANSRVGIQVQYTLTHIGHMSRVYVILQEVAFDVEYSDAPVGGGSSGSGRLPIFIVQPGGGIDTVDTPPETNQDARIPPVMSRCWEFDGRLFFFDSALSRTFCFDPEAGDTGGEWSDTGWNFTGYPAVVRTSYIEETLIMQCLPYHVWNPNTGKYGTVQDITVLPEIWRQGYYTTNRYIQTQAAAPMTGTNFRHWPKIVRYRPMDGEGTMMRQRLKRLVKATLWGEQEKHDPPQRVGWVVISSDNGRQERYPIQTYKHQAGDTQYFGTTPERTMLLQQTVTGNMTGRVFDVAVELEQEDVTLRDILLEYVILD